MKQNKTKNSQAVWKSGSCLLFLGECHVIRDKQSHHPLSPVEERSKEVRGHRGTKHAGSEAVPVNPFPLLLEQTGALGTFLLWLSLESFLTWGDCMLSMLIVVCSLQRVLTPLDLSKEWCLPLLYREPKQIPLEGWIACKLQIYNLWYFDT